jgi:inorganic triphosphatase YgiF
MRELELKFSLPLSLQDSLAQGADGERVERVWSRYYDTPDGALARARMAVRVRRKGDRWLQTVKADDGDRFERFEWERPIAGPAPERDALPPEDTPQGAIVHRTFGQWRPLFETDFERRSRVIAPAGGLEVELAQDVGEVRCGERREPIREVELECLRGDRRAFFDWALGWATREQACLLMPTKNERGLRLAARLPLAPPPVKAAPAAPGPALPADAAAVAVLRACVAHACANLEPILSSDDPEGPHQLRVSLRRLRAALRLFGLRERDARWARVDEEARTLADAAGRVRDLDVFEDGALPSLRAKFPGDAAVETLSRAVTDARADVRMELRRVLAGPQATRFVLGTLALVEELAAGAEADAPGWSGFAGTRVDALLARVRRRARRARDADGWHRTRLAVKTLRYALEFASAALPRGTDPARAAGVLARWQDRLGAGQDLATSRDVAADALSRPDVPPEAAVRALALIDGWRAFAAPSDSDPERHARRALKTMREALHGAGARSGTRQDAARRDERRGPTASASPDTAASQAPDTAASQARDASASRDPADGTPASQADASEVAQRRDAPAAPDPPAKGESTGALRRP